MAAATVKRVTIETLAKMKKSGDRIVMLTAYDYTSARFADEGGMDVILIGDSLGMVMQGQESTLPVTMDEMLYHTKIVARHSRRALIVADMPFMSYQAATSEAIRNAGRFLKEAGAHAVKLEGGVLVKDKIEAITAAQIPVMAHIGMTPQSVNLTSGYKPNRDAGQLVKDALACEAAGAFAVVLECVPEAIAKTVTAKLKIPTIGIGASGACDGQVLVYHDLLGMFEDFKPKFVKQYVNLAPTIRTAIAEYTNEVRNGTFPGKEHSY